MALDEMVRNKQAEIQERKHSKPLDALKSTLRPSDRSLVKALRKPPTGFILECKRSSPSRGLLRSEFNPAEIASSYEISADAVSVLCDRTYFGGDLAHLDQVSRTARCPVLCKDIVVDPYQVYEARGHGADAILLMLSVLDESRFVQCLAACRSLDMDALVEVHNEQELYAALQHGVDIIGINNRNLKTLEVDLQTTEKLAPLVPRSVILLSESGVRNHQDIVRLRDLVDGFLVGSALMERPDLDLAVREIVYGRVKVCGLTTSRDVKNAYQAGASWGGLIFAEQSPRKIDERQAFALRKAADLSFAGVFVNPDFGYVVRLAESLELDAVQVHGEIDADWVHRLRSMLPERCQLWKAVQIEDHVPVNEAWHANRLVLDTKSPGLYGGCGKSFDWSLLKGYPHRDEIILAGGIGVGNAALADRIGAWALDVNSGVEEAPGVKNERRMQDFFLELRGKGRNCLEGDKQ